LRLRNIKQAGVASSGSAFDTLCPNRGHDGGQHQKRRPRFLEYLPGQNDWDREEKLTSETKIKGHKVAASPKNPEYLVESDKSGDEAAHRPSALKKTK